MPQRYFISSSNRVLDKKSFLKIQLNPELNLQWIPDFSNHLWTRHIISKLEKSGVKLQWLKESIKHEMQCLITR